MDVIDIAKRSLRTLWVNKHLWFFGFFVASLGSGGGGDRRHQGGHIAVEALPAWAWALLAVAAVVGLVTLVLHILSEAALIEGVAESEKGERLAIGQGLQRGRKHFWKLVGLKVLLGLVMLVSFAVIAAPAALAHFGLIPIWLGVVVAVLLGLVGIPWLLTVYFIYEYALRFAVLEDHATFDAIRRARRFLHGRLGLSLKLILLSIVWQLGGWVALGVAMIPGALLGGLTYLVAGMVPGVVVFALFAAPLAAMVVGALGTFRSSIWTLGFMDHHYAA